MAFSSPRRALRPPALAESGEIPTLAKMSVSLSQGEGQAMRCGDWAGVTDRGDRRAGAVSSEAKTRRKMRRRLEPQYPQGPRPHSCRALSDMGRREGSLTCPPADVQLSLPLGCLPVPSHSPFVCPVLCVFLPLSARFFPIPLYSSSALCLLVQTPSSVPALCLEALGPGLVSCGVWVSIFNFLG